MRECIRRQQRGMFAHIVRPGRAVLLEAADVAGEQGARGLLVAGLVAGHRLHEAIGRFLRNPTAVYTLIDRLVKELGNTK